MNARHRAVMLALSAALALGACTKAPTMTSEVNGQLTAGSAATLPLSDRSPTTLNDAATPTPNGDDAAPPSVNAQLKGDRVDIRAEATTEARIVATLNSKNKLGSRTTLLVRDRKDGWLKVSLPTRPNGQTGWIEETQVELRATDVAIEVDLGARKATVTKAGRTVLETPVAIGSDQNKTPKGEFYVTDLVQTDEPGGAYGPYAFGLSAHSETLTEFGGGDGQVALHGTNDPNSIGKAVSHGCVRIPNGMINQLADLATLGTPVTIV